MFQNKIKKSRTQKSFMAVGDLLEKEHVRGYHHPASYLVSWREPLSSLFGSKTAFQIF